MLVNGIRVARAFGDPFVAEPVAVARNNLDIRIGLPTADRKQIPRERGVLTEGPANVVPQSVTASDHQRDRRRNKQVRGSGDDIAAAEIDLGLIDLSV